MFSSREPISLYWVKMRVPSPTLNLLQQLQQAEELPAALYPAVGPAPFVQELRRVVADLLEPGEHQRTSPLRSMPSLSGRSSIASRTTTS